MITNRIGPPAGRIHCRVHPRCVVCSNANGKGLHMDFDIAEDHSVSAEFNCSETFEGYPGMMHGGVISTILDGAMGHCMFALGLTTVTIEMTVKFRLPIETGIPATVRARITRLSHPVYFLESEIIQDGRMKATTKAKYYDQPHLINPESSCEP